MRGAAAGSGARVESPAGVAGVDLPAAIVAWLRGRQIDPAMLQERYGVVTQKDIELVQLEGLGEEDL